MILDSISAYHLIQSDLENYLKALFRGEEDIKVEVSQGWGSEFVIAVG